MKQGKKRGEDTGEHRRTSPGVSRMRYQPLSMNVPSHQRIGLGRFVTYSTWPRLPSSECSGTTLVLERELEPHTIGKRFPSLDVDILIDNAGDPKVPQTL